ncbi:MAG: hypothetical protein H6Q14_1736 [Bacteroidetes bacterium]|nr:hypothetical protein [Bacteroidota bacterium]
MTTTSESGYAKNLANFESLIILIKALGSNYNPSKESIKVSALEAILQEGKDIFTAFNSAKSTYSISVDAQQKAFKPLSPLITRVNNALKASGSTSENHKTAQTIIRKLQGRRAVAKLKDEEKKALEAEGKIINQISVSQMGYASRLDNFGQFISFLSTISTYNPNEEDLKITTLATFLSELKAKNLDVTSSGIQMNMIRATRNEVFKHPERGIAKVASDAKTYVKSVFGATSSQYKQIAKIAIR